MMRAVFSSPTYDLDGCVELQVEPGGSDLKSNTRRVSRTATLDGGAVITDAGFSEADRTIRVRAIDVSEAAEAALWYLFQTYSLLNLALPEGVFSGAIENIVNGFGVVTITFLVKDKLSVSLP